MSFTYIPGKKSSEFFFTNVLKYLKCLPPIFSLIQEKGPGATARKSGSLSVSGTLYLIVHVITHMDSVLVQRKIQKNYSCSQEAGACSPVFERSLICMPQEKVSSILLPPLQKVIIRELRNTSNMEKLNQLCNRFMRNKDERKQTQQ